MPDATASARQERETMTTPIEPPDTSVATLAARAREAAAAARNADEKEERDSSETQGDEDSGRLIVMLDEYPAFAPAADPSEVASNFSCRVSLSSVAPNAAELMWPSAETKE
ncbi:hypothetical protein ACKAMS_33255 [Rhodococcus sp. 5A-K4]|uniref:hypothetical protein n=1 Tax=Rhodococcus TaxID=1827 RepID=UPI001EE96B6B|nr:hypothetical protein [Rhodococcus sp. WY5]